MHVAPRTRSPTPPPLTFAGPAAEIIQVRRRAVDVAVPQSPGPSNPGCSLGERTRKTQRIAAAWHASPQRDRRSGTVHLQRADAGAGLVRAPVRRLDLHRAGRPHRACVDRRPSRHPPRAVGRGLRVASGRRARGGAPGGHGDVMRALLAGLVTATLLLLAATAQTSGANFTAQRSNVADSV